MNRTTLLACNVMNTLLSRRAHRLAYTPFGFGGQQGTGFNGQYRETPGDVYILGNGYRIHSGQLMRFYSPDSISPFLGDLNAYAYCQGDPLNRVDPTGHLGYGRRYMTGNNNVAVLDLGDDAFFVNARKGNFYLRGHGRPNQFRMGRRAMNANSLFKYIEEDIPDMNTFEIQSCYSDQLARQLSALTPGIPVTGYKGIFTGFGLLSLGNDYDLPHETFQTMQRAIIEDRDNTPMTYLNGVQVIRQP